MIIYLKIIKLRNVKITTNFRPELISETNANAINTLKQNKRRHTILTTLRAVVVQQKSKNKGYL